MGITVAVERRLPADIDPPPAEPLTRGERSASDNGGLSLLWRLFLANGAVLALVVVLLAVTPIEITAPVAKLEQLLILLAGLVVMLAINLLLLRRSSPPPATDRTDGRCRSGPAGPQDSMTWLCATRTSASSPAAFNGMLDRLEFERRESARAALAAQERERLRVARELHDEIGQTLTAVTLEAERAADNGARRPDGGAAPHRRRHPGQPRRGPPHRA